MDRIVLHLDMDAFFAAIEERDNPQFAGKPIVVGADPKNGHGRGVVSTANYEARKYGIKSAMPISWAYRSCPTAIFFPVDMKRYVKVSQNVMAIIKKHAKVMEQVSVDEAYFEMNSRSEARNSKQKYKEAEKIANKIKREIKTQEKLTCSVGIGPNKIVAKIASGYKKPDGLTIVRPSKVQNFLDPKSATVIPGIGPKTYAVLQKKWNVKTVSDLRKIKEKELEETFGVYGKRIFDMARGIDNRPIEEVREVKSIGRQITFEKDTKDSQTIVNECFEILKEIFKELEEQSLKGNTLTIIVRYAWFETHTAQQKVDKPLKLETAKKLCLKLLLRYLGKKPVRLVGVRISDFEN